MIYIPLAFKIASILDEYTPIFFLWNIHLILLFLKLILLIIFWVSSFELSLSTLQKTKVFYSFKKLKRLITMISKSWKDWFSILNKALFIYFSILSAEMHIEKKGGSLITFILLYNFDLLQSYIYCLFIFKGSALFSFFFDNFYNL